MASSSRLVKNPASPDISIPLQGAIIPGVEEPYQHDPQKDHHFSQTRCAQSTKCNRPRVQENQLNVEQNKKNCGEIELDRHVAGWNRKRDASALERLRFHQMTNRLTLQVGHCSTYWTRRIHQFYPFCASSTDYAVVVKNVSDYSH